MKKIVITLTTLMSVLLSAAAQESVPAYRATGYKGNVSLVNTGLLWNGIDTSHGYMFNERYYWGGGANFGFMPWGNTAIIAAGVFTEAQAYWLPRKNTPITAVRLNYVRNFSGDSHNLFADITVGWSWGLGSQYGLSLKAGFSAPIIGGLSWVNIDLHPVYLAPVFSVSFEF